MKQKDNRRACNAVGVFLSTLLLPISSLDTTDVAPEVIIGPA